MTFERSEDYELVTFVSLVVLFGVLEAVAPARQVNRREQLPMDLLAAAVALLGVSLTRWACKTTLGPLAPDPTAPASGLGVLSALASLPSVLKVGVAIVVVDFCLYWVHRAMHTAPLWRTHMLHHSPEHMYWLAGLRTSLTHVAMFTAPQVIVPFFVFSTSALEGAVVVGAINVAQFVTHANLRLRLGPLGRVLVMPAVHRLHHAREDHHRRNFASLLVVWDRLFGTYQDPDVIQGEIALGLQEDRHRALGLRGLVGV
ncbi:MAG TPA: sterol desaturase family protein [Kofleriaceae bacterium]|nr:sterol desaturase family protein [Kofleriaceae bacterium]